MNRKGFTMIELILVIAILGILAVTALPKYFDMARQSEIAAMQGTVGAVRSGIAMYKANQIVALGGNGAYPSGLGVNFASVLDDNFVATNTGWSGSGDVFNYVHGGVNATWTYASGTGVLTCAGNCNN